MVADCGATCAKYLLCLFNFAFFMVGSAVLCIGIWLAVAKESFINLTRISTTSFNGGGKNDIKLTLEELTEPSVIEQGAYILIAAGAFIFIISFLGYCGAIKESRVLLTAYGIFIIIIALLQVAAIVLAAVFRNKALVETEKFAKYTLTKYYTDKDHRDAVTLSWDFMQAELGCCGVTDFHDFEGAEKFQQYVRSSNSGQIVPESCCFLKNYTQNDGVNLFTPESPDCITTPTPQNSNFNKGCYDKIKRWIQDNLNIVIGTAAGVIGLQVLGIIFAFCLCKAVSSERNYHRGYKY